MGAWGSGSFENDTALDWAYGIESVADVAKPFERLKRESDVHPAGGDMPIDADFASELVAAAECVAAMMGHRIHGFPEELAEVLDGAPEPDALLFHQARNAMVCVIRHSELAELWEEATEEGETNAWLHEISELVERLNPDLEWEPGPASEFAEEDGGSSPQCCFCRQSVEGGQMFTLKIENLASNSVSFTRYLPVHLACLNARLHRDTAILEFRDDPERPYDPDML